MKKERERNTEKALDAAGGRYKLERLINRQTDIQTETERQSSRKKNRLITLSEKKKK